MADMTDAELADVLDRMAVNSDNNIVHNTLYYAALRLRSLTAGTAAITTELTARLREAAGDLKRLPDPDDWVSPTRLLTEAAERIEHLESLASLTAGTDEPVWETSEERLSGLLDGAEECARQGIPVQAEAADYAAALRDLTAARTWGRAQAARLAEAEAEVKAAVAAGIIVNEFRQTAEAARDAALARAEAAEKALRDWLDADDIWDGDDEDDQRVAEARKAARAALKARQP